jgi:hypothetical protein
MAAAAARAAGSRQAESRPADPVATPAPTIPALRKAKYNQPSGLGVSYGDGFRFGVGFGIAVAVILPILIGVFYCVISMVIGTSVLSLFR